MILLKISALSVNQAWQGRRFKTKKYKDYEENMFQKGRLATLTYHM
jgi:hypothetical protein